MPQIERIKECVKEREKLKEIETDRKRQGMGERDKVRSLQTVTD